MTGPTPPVVHRSVSDALFRSLIDGADAEAAFVLATRALLERDQSRSARALSQSLAREPGLAVAADLCRVLLAEHDPMYATGWTLLTRNDLATVLRLVPDSYVRIGLRFDADATLAALGRLLDGEYATDADAAQWLGIARACFAVDRPDLAAAALDRAEALPHDRYRRGVARLRTWLRRAVDARRPVPAPEQQIAFALLDLGHPDPQFAPREVGLAVESLAALGHLTRRAGVRFVGDDDALVRVAEDVRGRIDPDRLVDGPAATVRLYPVDRDVSHVAEIPDGTWVIASGSLVNPIFDLRHDLPLDPRLRPVFVGVHVDVDALGAPGAVGYLRDHAPIGCADWNSVYLLHAAGVEAFFSGPLGLTAGSVVVARRGPRPRTTRHIDVPGAKGETGSWRDPGLASRTLAANFREALRHLDDLHGAGKVVTTDVACYWAARSLGVKATLRFRPRSGFRFDQDLDVSDAEFARLRKGIDDKLADVLAAITAGRTPDEVAEVWRGACARDVATARDRIDALPELGPPSFDVARACARIRSESVVIERAEPGPDGAEINVEFSLDGNLKHEMGVVLDSIVAHASRPIRLFVLCRDHGAEDFKRMAALFPTVSFVWLPTDHVDYGEILGMIGHITIATMDRLLLPELLPELDRIVHHDLDALCCADLAGLFDVDLGDAPLAARDQMHPNDGSAYRGFVRQSASRHRARPALGSELMLRLSRRHPFDVPAFNAGIMVFNLDRMRRDGFTRYLLPYAERFGQNDQEVLNAYCASERVPLEAAWNAFPKLELVDEPKVLHWLGALKPWKPMYVAERERWLAADAEFTLREKAVLG